MQEAVKKFVTTCLESAQKTKEKIPHGLSLIDMPTGSGKTHNTLLLIKEYLESGSFENVKRIFYLTPLAKNANDAFNKLGDLMEDEKELYEENCLRVLANYDAVLENLLNISNKIPAEIKRKESYKNLENYIRTYKSLEAGDDIGGNKLNMKMSFANEIRMKYEPKFRMELKEWISKLGGNKKSKLIKIKSEMPWLLELYPSILTDDRKIYFMTVDKFCSVNDPIIGKSYRFINSQLTRGSLIFIDEVDASKEYILRSQIDESVRKKTDLIRLFSTLSGSFASGRKYPTENLPKPEDGEYKHSSEYAFKSMKDLVTGRRDEFHLDYPFKLESEGEQDRCFLFEDHAIHTISASKKDRYISIDTKEEKGQNIISFTKNKNENSSFFRMIYGMNGALSFTIKSLILMSRNYLNYYNNVKKKKDADMMEPDEAVSTILAPFELDDGLQESLKKMVVDDFNFPMRKKKKSLVDSDFYTDGFRHFDFIDDISHDTVTTINMCFLNETPEKFLLNLASRSMVVGISATASIDTVTGNYNLFYLKRKLGESFYSLPSIDVERMKSLVENRNFEQKYNIFIDEIAVNETDTEPLSKLIFTEDDDMDILSSILDTFTDDAKGFKKRRYIKVIFAIKQFISNAKGKAMLVLTNNNLRSKNSDDAFSYRTIAELTNLICKECGLSPENIGIHILSGVSFESEKKSYLNDMRHGKRCLLFSSYPASGTGQNLQYSIIQGEDETNELEKDIDSIYLEKPTNILVNMTKTNYDGNNILTESDLIKYCYQAESLRNTGEISHIKSLNMIRKGFKVFMKGEIQSVSFANKQESEYRTNSVNNHIVKIIEQAVGRICRTRDNEKNDVHIYVDDDIYNHISFDFVKDKPINREFLELINHAKNHEIVNTDLSKNLNVASERCDRLESELNSWMKDTKKLWTEDQIIGWKKLREWVLTHPTCTIEEAEKAGFSQLYLDSSEGHTASVAYYEKNENIFKLSFKQIGKFTNEISAVDSNLCFLMNIPCVKKYFSEHGYATEFKANECILNPVAYINLYKGAVGEAAGLAILQDNGILIEEITDPRKFEKFDYVLKTNHDIYFDFKNWNQYDNVSNNEMMDKFNGKLEKVDGKKAYVINIVADKLPHHDSGTICTISHLVHRPDSSRKNLYVDQKQIAYLIKNISEVK